MSQAQNDPRRRAIRNTVIGQVIDDDKARVARQLRKQMTLAERRLRQSLRNNRLAGNHFRRQQVIAGFVVDFYCHSAALIVEVDGPIHESQLESDGERDAALTSHGFRVLRISNDAVFGQLENVLSRIVQACNG